MQNICIEQPKAITTSENPLSSTSVIETKPPPSTSTTAKPEIKPTKPVVKSTKQLSSVVRVVSANAPIQNTPKSISSKVQIVASHVGAIGDKNNGELREPSTILSSRVEVIGGVSPTES